MVWLSKLKICFKTYEDIKKFIHVVTAFASDVNIIKGSHVFDAKSIMGVIEISPDDSNTYVEILSNDSEEIQRFNNAMGEFIG